MQEKSKPAISVSMGLFELIGIITFIVFLTLKLSNSGNPSYEWLTWFWVFFPLWIPIATSLGILLLIIILGLLVGMIAGGLRD